MYIKTISALFVGGLLVGCSDFIPTTDSTPDPVINQAPVSQITQSNSVLQVASTDDQDTQSQMTYVWFVNDVQTSTADSLDISQLINGTRVTLETTDTDGESDTDTFIITGSTYSPNNAPVADIQTQSNLTSGTVPLTIMFDGSASSDLDEADTLTYAWSFGDGPNAVTSDLINPSYVFDAADNYTVTLTVTDNHGETAFKNINITATDPLVDLDPVASFTMDLSSGDAPLSVNFDAMASSDDIGLVSYVWDFGDMSETVNPVDPTHVFEQPGDYIVRLTVADSTGQTHFIEQSVSVLEANVAPTAEITTDKTEGDAPLTVVFDASKSMDLNADDTLTYAWNFGDGPNATTSDLIKPTYVFDTADNYTVTLIVSDNDGETASTFVNIVATAPAEDLNPVASFTMDLSSGDAPLSVNFDAMESSDDIGLVSYVWDFGDMSDTVNAVGPTHVFEQPGDYIVRLTVADSTGQTHFIEHSVSVLEANVAPTADIQTDKLTGESPLTVMFDASGSMDLNAADTLTYSWDFGDGATTSNLINPTYEFNTADNYTVTLIVSDNHGATASTFINITATDPLVDLDPVASFTMTPSSGDAPLSVKFDAMASSDDKGLASYLWDFGDMTDSANTVDPTHVFEQVGDYIVRLTVTDSANQTHFIEQTISVLEANVAPTADIQADIVTGVAPLSVMFDASGSMDLNADDTLTYSWDFGDGGATSDLINPAYEFNDANNYKVTLTVTDNDGETASTFINIIATAPVIDLNPIASFTMAPSSGDAPLLVKFDAMESSDDNGLAEYLWDFGDMTASANTVDPTHIFTQPGEYIVRLTVTDTANQTHFIEQSVSVLEFNVAPTAVITTNKIQGDAPLSVMFDASESTDSNATDTLTYSWNFGTALSSLEKPSHIFATHGEYTVSLTVTDNKLLSDTVSVVITVNEVVEQNVAPVADFSVSVQAGPAPLLIAFDGTESTDANNDNLNYSWNFGDVNDTTSSILAMPTHSFSADGIYDVVLTVNDGEFSDTKTLSITVDSTIPVNQLPTASFEVSNVDLKAIVDATLSSDPEMFDLTYAWEFINENDTVVGYQAGVMSEFNFATAAVKSVRLTVTDSEGQIDTLTKTIETTPSDDPGLGDGTILFIEDYEGSVSGENPVGWGANVGSTHYPNPSATQFTDSIKVVSDNVKNGNNALWVNGNNLSGGQNYSTYDLPANTDRLYLRFYFYSRQSMGAKSVGNHNHFLALGEGPNHEIRIGEMKGYMIGLNEFPSDALVPKYEFWNTGDEMAGETWQCIEVAFLNDGPYSEFYAWLNNDLVTQVTDGNDFHNELSDTWLDGKFDKVQLGWANFGTYDNDVYFDDIVGSTERIGCDGSTGLPTAVLTPKFEMAQELMVANVDASASTGDTAFKYSWDFDGEHTATGATASYAFATAGPKKITLTLTSENTIETLEQTIVIVEAAYTNLLESVATNIVTPVCLQCHTVESNKPIKFGDGSAADVEAGIAKYITADFETRAGFEAKVDTVKFTPSSTAPFVHNPGDKLGANKQDWEDLIDWIAIIHNPGNGFGGLDAAFINDNFDGQTDGTTPAGWSVYLNYNIGSSNTLAGSSYALIDSSKAHSGSSSVHVKTTGSNYASATMFFREMDQGKDAYFVRSWMYLSSALGGGVAGTGDEDHVHMMAFSSEVGGSSQELRFGAAKTGVLSAYLPEVIRSGSTNVVPTQTLNADEWVCVEFAMVKNPDIDYVFAWINDEPLFEITSAEDWEKGNPGNFFSEATAQQDVSKLISLGWRPYGNNHDMDELWFDDVVVSDERIGCDL